MTDLSLAIGTIDPTNGHALAVLHQNPNDSTSPVIATSPNMLLATTYGRGQFAVRLSPVVFPSSVARFGLDPNDDTGASSSDNITKNAAPHVVGVSQQTAFGNVVRITLLDLTDPAHPGSSAATTRRSRRPTWRPTGPGPTATSGFRSTPGCSPPTG